MAAEESTNPLEGAVDSQLKLDIMRLFANSPDAVDCPEGIGLRIGYFGADLEGALTQLSGAGILESVGTGSLAIFRLRKTGAVSALLERVGSLGDSYRPASGLQEEQGGSDA
ncbi:MAG: hypothetical protein GF320_00450 [Armatimonadia bacterium]|jgi:hypothetical protein|nr:hypothetical protein [Armatimonadia bacterium]